MSITVIGSTAATGEGILSKYVFRFRLSDTLIATFNANTDIATISFHSQDTLTLHTNSEDDLKGYRTFSGTIGKNKLKITFDNGIRIDGTIEGGPTKVQSIVGAGTWLRS